MNLQSYICVLLNFYTLMVFLVNNDWPLEMNGDRN